MTTFLLIGGGVFFLFLLSLIVAGKGIGMKESDIDWDEVTKNFPKRSDEGISEWKNTIDKL